MSLPYAAACDTVTCWTVTISFVIVWPRAMSFAAITTGVVASRVGVGVAELPPPPPPLLERAMTPTKATTARRMPTRIRIRFDRFTTSLPGICDRCQHSGLRSTEPRLYQWATPPRKDSPNRRQSRASPEPTPTYFRELMSIPTPGRGQTLPG